MILDTSAIVAIALKEPGFEELLGKLAKERNAGFLIEGSIATVPFGDAHFAAAVDAWLQYGKGRHTASLNFGDCLSYATAALAGEPLLCVGNDFAQTDLALA